MSTKSKFDPSQVANLLNRGTQEARTVPLVASVETPREVTLSVVAPDAAPTAFTAVEPPATTDPAAATKKPITIRLSEPTLHALYRHQAELRMQSGVRLSETTIGAVIDKLLQRQLGV
jgi:hypothetical protein